MRPLFRYSWLAALLFIPIILVLLSVPRLISGVALERAFPAPHYMSRNIILSRQAYADAESGLAAASIGDGGTGIARAEAAIFTGAPPAMIETLLRENLARTPMSGRGWTLLAERLAPGDAAAAASALSQAQTLGPLEYGLIGKQTRLAAALGDGLSLQSRQAALRQTVHLWREPQLHSELRLLAFAPGGPDLIEAAFGAEPTEFEDVLAWLDTYRASPRPN